MDDGARKAGIVLAAVALVTYVYAPLLGAGPFGRDLLVLSSLAELERPEAETLYGIPGLKNRPLAALSLWLSAKAWVGGAWSGPEVSILRIENLLLLLVGAFGLRNLLARALAPFLGSEQARSAGVAAGTFFLLHPLCVDTVAQLTGRGELLATAAGAHGLHLFLRGRQENQFFLVVLAGVLFTLAAFAGRMAGFLPPLAACVEFLSARRHRSLRKRLRAAASTLALVALLISIERLWRLALLEPVVRGVPSQRGVLDGLALWIEKVGVLFLPVDTYGIGRTGYAVAAVATLLALHPAFVAARSAPRLWGRILVGWGVALALAELSGLKERVEPRSLAGAEVLFPAAVVMSVGLGASATAIQGVRRTLIPVAVCVAFALLGRGHAWPFETAARTVADLRRELQTAAELQRWEGSYLVIDPPGTVRGVDVLHGALGTLLRPSMSPAAPPEVEEKGLWLRGMSAAAFATYIGEPEFEARRRAGLCVLGPKPEGGGPRLARPLPAPDGPTRPVQWTDSGHSPVDLGADPLIVTFARAQPAPGARTSAPPVVRWQEWGASEPVETEAYGIWASGANGLEAWFDLSSELRWLLAGRLSAVWFPGALSNATEASLQAGPALELRGVAPRQVEGDWLFDLGELELARPLRGEPLWVLAVLDLVTLEQEEFVLGHGAAGRLRARGLAEVAQRTLTKHHGPLAWRLEARLEGVALARARGRLEP